MLTPEYIASMPLEIQGLFLEMEDQILEDIARRINKGVKLTATADYQVDLLNRMGYNVDDITRELSKTTALSQQKIERLLTESTYLSHSNDQLIYKAGGKVLTDLDPLMKRLLLVQIQNAQGDLKNLTRTMGIATGSGFKDITSFYRDAVNIASVKLKSGAFTYDQVIKQAVKELADSGLRTINYKSGYSSHLDVAVRRNILTASSQITGLISERNADLMGQDLMEISSHMGARPSHSEWQGEIVSRSGDSKGYLTLDDIGYDDVTGFKGINCRHDWFPYFEGISVRGTKAEDPPPFKYNGKDYDAYTATQYQRKIERDMRTSRREINVYKGAGLSQAEKESRIKLRRQREHYKDFSNEAGIRPKFERTQVYKGDFGKVSIG